MNAPANRIHLGQWLTQLGLCGDGVEVGTHKGEFAEHILKTWSGRKLFCVDCWSEVAPDNRLFNEQPTDKAQERYYQEAVARLAPYGNRVEIIRAFSLIAAPRFAEHSLDFVYIDAAHDFNSTMADLLAWWPAIRVGGVMCGDDFIADYPDVIRAVNIFSGSVSKELLTTTGGTNRQQWYIIR